MRTLRTSSITFLLTCLLGILAASVGAGGAKYGVSIDGISANCTDLEVIAFFGFDNFDGGSGSETTVTITVTGVGTTFDTYIVDFEPFVPFDITLPLSSTLQSNVTYTLTLTLSNGEKAVQTFVACTGSGTEASSSTKPVELPPCKLSDERLDETCGSAPIVVYSQVREDGCYVTVYSKYGRADGKTVLLLQATPAEIAAAQANEGNAVIDSVKVVNLGTVTVYWLPGTGEFQINAGPNEEGKVYVINFTGCPATNVYTSNSYKEAQ